jgi:hypothetical protein
MAVTSLSDAGLFLQEDHCGMIPSSSGNPPVSYQRKEAEIPEKKRRNLRKTYEVFRVNCRSFRHPGTLLFAEVADRINTEFQKESDGSSDTDTGITRKIHRYLSLS